LRDTDTIKKKTFFTADVWTPYFKKVNLFYLF